MNLKLNHQKHKKTTLKEQSTKILKIVQSGYNKVSGVLFWDEANLKVCTSPHFVKLIRILSMYNAPYPFCPSYLYRWARQKQLKVKGMQNIGSMLLPGSFAPYVGQIFLKERSATTRLNFKMELCNLRTNHTQECEEKPCKRCQHMQKGQLLV